MSYCGRTKYYMAEQKRLVECAETLMNIFSQDCAVDDIPTAKDILREMFARLDTWDRLRHGDYETFCTPNDCNEYRRLKVQLSSVYGECVADE